MSAIRITAALFCLLLLGLPHAAAQEELSGRALSPDVEVSRGFYEDYEVRPLREPPFRDYNRPADEGIRFQQRWNRLLDEGGLSPLRMSDAHWNVPNWQSRRCEVCHVRAAGNNLHVTRYDIGCRQCHRGATIAPAMEYASRMNPIRRHATICGQCHKGAGASFALYKVHEPSPYTAEAAEIFPWLYWVFWIMVGIMAVTFAFFLPLTLVWYLRELFEALLRKKEDAT